VVVLLAPLLDTKLVLNGTKQSGLLFGGFTTLVQNGHDLLSAPVTTTSQGTHLDSSSSTSSGPEGRVGFGSCEFGSVAHCVVERSNSSE
jgi:hypothetical protein